MNQDTRLAEALDRSELTNLVFRFTQAVDRGDFETMADCCGAVFRAKASGFGSVIVDVDSLAEFTKRLRAAGEANPGAQSQHRYFDPTVAVEGDSAQIRLSGEVFNASPPAAEARTQNSADRRAGTLMSSGLQTTYSATREAAGWRLASLDVVYQWRRALETAP